MIINRLVPFQRVSIAVIQPFHFNREIFLRLFSDEMDKSKNFTQINAVDQSWFNATEYKKYLFSNSNEGECTDASGCIYRFKYNISTRFEPGTKNGSRAIKLSTPFTLGTVCK